MIPVSLLVLLVIQFFTVTPRVSHQETQEWGITFSQKMAEDLNVDWRQAYTAMVDDLRPQKIRLVAYWDKIESEKGDYNFSDLDWQMNEAQLHQIPVVLVVGKKVPRWPECHVPLWANDMSNNELEPLLHDYVSQIVHRYKDSPNLYLWQVENEPFIHFGDCSTLSKEWLSREVDLVRSLDPNHKILVTDGGAWGGWYTSAKTGDVFGTTLYTKVYRLGIGHTRPPFPSGYYRLKRDIIRHLTKKSDQPYVFMEVGLEPWGAKSIADMTVEEQKQELSLDEFRSTVLFAKKTGYQSLYLWGAEWWYSMKVNGDPRYWDEAKQTMESKYSNFPSDFLWGAATSSHQAEGENHNDWTAWEELNAERLAGEAEQQFGRQSPVWSKVQREANSPANYISGATSDQYHQYNDDFALAESLGMNAQRISLEWSRIEPKQGVFNQSELNHYRQVIDSLMLNGQVPFVTLWHYTLPIWFADLGGWENPESPELFSGYVQEVAEALGPNVRYWITINEPGVYASSAYLLGKRPPMKKKPLVYWKVYNRLAAAHNEAYKAIKQHDHDALVGIAQDTVSFQVVKPWPHLILAEKLASWYNNRYFFDRIQQDFIGINYYIDYELGGHAIRDKSDLGWELHPTGLKQVAQNVSRYGKPIYITENGLADKEDRYRGEYIAEMIDILGDLRREGCDIRGYFHWSLIDNFEWDKGFWPRFGLIEVDYATQKRTVRSSALKYKELITSEGKISN